VKGKNEKMPVSTIKRMAAFSLVLLSFVFLLIAHFIPACTIEADMPVRTPMGETIETGLDGEIYLHRFDIGAKVEGGIVGEKVEIQRDGYFLEGPGDDLSDRLGVIMNSHGNYTYEMASRTSGTYDPYKGRNNGGKIAVKSVIERVPFWVGGLEYSHKITIYLNNTMNLSRVDISRVWVEVWYDYNDDTNDYEKKKVVWERDVNDVLEDETDFLEYSHSMKYTTSEDKIGIATRAECTMTDILGNTDDSPDLPFASDSYPHPHNVYVVTHYNGIRVALLVLAFPMFIISALLAIPGSYFIFKSQRRAFKYFFSGGVITGLGIFFYWWGVNAVIEMSSASSALSAISKNFFEWNWAVFIPLVSSVMLLGAGVFIRLSFPPSLKDIEEVEECYENDDGSVMEGMDEGEGSS